MAERAIRFEVACVYTFLTPTFQRKEKTSKPDNSSPESYRKKKKVFRGEYELQFPMEKHASLAVTFVVVFLYGGLKKV